MKLLAGLLLSLALAPIAASASTIPPTLTMNITNAGVRTLSEDRYPANGPLSIVVNSDHSLGIRAVTLTVNAPSGKLEVVPLTLSANRFTGTLMLHEVGAYTIALTSSYASGAVVINAIALTVVPTASRPQHVEWASAGLPAFAESVSSRN